MWLDTFRELDNSFSLYIWKCREWRPTGSFLNLIVIETTVYPDYNSQLSLSDFLDVAETISYLIGSNWRKQTAASDYQPALWLRSRAAWSSQSFQAAIQTKLLTHPTHPNYNFCVSAC